MTNREILKTPKDVLVEVDRQRLFLLRVESTPVPCPACKKPVNAFEAAGIDLDDYDFGHTKVRCSPRACKRSWQGAIPACQ